MKLTSPYLVLVLLLSACTEQTGYFVRGDRVFWAEYAGTAGFTNLSRVEREVDADPESFRVEREGAWASDRTHAYYKGREAGPVVQESFRALDRDFATDGVTVWRLGRPVEGADAASFRLIGDGYAVDAERAYYGGAGFSVCDPATFRVIVGGVDRLAADDACVYSASFRLPLEHRESFSVLGAGYSRDRSQVYWGHRVVEGADPRSFTVPDGMRYGRDRSGCWSGVRRIECLAEQP